MRRVLLAGGILAGLLWPAAAVAYRPIDRATAEGNVRRALVFFDSAATVRFTGGHRDGRGWVLSYVESYRLSPWDLMDCPGWARTFSSGSRAVVTVDQTGACWERSTATRVRPR